MAAKPTGTQPTVNAALVHRQFAFLPGEICAASGELGLGHYPDGSPEHQEPGAAASCPLRTMKLAAPPTLARSAPGGDAGRDGAEVSRCHSRRGRCRGAEGLKEAMAYLQSGVQFGKVCLAH
jgi:hypothetical protein